MLKNENIICISSIDWDFIWQGHQEIMSTLASNGNRVLFIENTGVRIPVLRDFPRIKNRIRNWFQGVGGIKEVRNNLYVFSPIILPFPYLRIATKINLNLILRPLTRWFKIMDFANPIIWVFLPTPLSLYLIDNIINKCVIYYCIDNFRVSSNLARKISKSEIKLLKRADLVFVTSDNLYKYCLNFNDKIYKFSFTVNLAKFAKEKIDNSSALPDIASIKRPIIGFSGGIRKWIDNNLLIYLANANPQFSFVFIGPLQMDTYEFNGIKNMYFLGQKDHNLLPNYINNFDVAIIPYLLNDFTQCIYPAKLNEYLMLGKPVVSTALIELMSLKEKYPDIVFIAYTKEEFNSYIKEALRDNDKELINKRINFACKNSWENYIEEMSRLIQNNIEIKNLDKETRWRQSLIMFYRLTRKRLLRFSAACCLIYLILFYTPLVWFLASPLKISEITQKADCIVVFAGGVGETGKAGQGYEERVQYAVELYNKKYAQHMIFSSGYSYIFKEPLIMKSLAVSLGVPSENIILEDKAKNTYENVKFTKEILNKHWDSILLVSTPYHMRRVSLVFNKIAPEIKVTYTPIINGLFFRHGGVSQYGKKIWKQINFEQLKSILHEYAAIVYYYFKGYIKLK